MRQSLAKDCKLICSIQNLEGVEIPAIGITFGFSLKFVKLSHTKSISYAAYADLKLLWTSSAVRRARPDLSY